jgi:hypothetical protein
MIPKQRTIGLKTFHKLKYYKFLYECFNKNKKNVVIRSVMCDGCRKEKGIRL